LIRTFFRNWRKRERTNPHVADFTEAVGWGAIHTSWIVIAELRRGAALVRPRDRTQADALDAWIVEMLRLLEGRVLAVDQPVAEAWVRLMVPNPRSPLDALIAATAMAHGLTLVTRNVRHFADAGIDLLDPWSFRP